MGEIRARVQLARTIAGALIEYAQALEDVEVGGEIVVRTVDDVLVPEDEHNLGRRQRQIVHLAGLLSEEGIRTAEIASAIQYEVPNTYSTLQALARQGIVELVPHKEPQHWRLARRYRPNAEAFKRMAGLVVRGEWTTYGDISIAVMGNSKGARGVGRAAAVVPDFPNPHRVLMAGGLISTEWKSHDGQGPEKCRIMLADEGIQFLEDGQADPRQRVDYDELRRRDAEASIQM